MRTIATIVLLAGVAVTAAQAQAIDSLPNGPRQGELVLPADSIMQLMAAIPLRKCPRPVSHGIVRDSTAVVRPGEHGAPLHKPAAMPTQRANCVNPLFAKR